MFIDEKNIKGEKHKNDCYVEMAIITYSKKTLFMQHSQKYLTSDHEICLFQNQLKKVLELILHQRHCWKSHNRRLLWRELNNKYSDEIRIWSWWIKSLSSEEKSKRSKSHSTSCWSFESLAKSTNDDSSFSFMERVCENKKKCKEVSFESF